MKIELFLRKSINDNASFYYDKAKKLRKKIEGLKKAISNTKALIEIEEKTEIEITKKELIKKIYQDQKKNWYDNFRWTKTINDYLVVIGKDSSTNEKLLKTYLEKDDIVIHTSNFGSPFGLIKGIRNKKLSEKDFNKNVINAMQFLLAFSKDWKRGLGSSDIFWVFPEQVTKTVQSGEYIKKGSFMIYGKKNIFKNVPLKICFGIIETKKIIDEGSIEYYKFFSGIEEVCKKRCKRYVKLSYGSLNYAKLTKILKKKFKVNYIEDLPKYIPNNCQILK